MSKSGLVLVSCVFLSFIPWTTTKADDPIRTPTSQGSVSQNTNVIVLGQIGHGKTMLVAAMSSFSVSQYGGKVATYDQIDQATKDNNRGVTIATTSVRMKSEGRVYTVIDSPTHSDYVKNLIAGWLPTDGAILVVSAVEGPMPQTREHIRLARQVGIPRVVVYLNDADMVEGAKRLRLVETEVRELLDAHQFSREDTPVISGSATKALQGDESKIGKPSIEKLIAAMDDFIALPKRMSDQPFLLPIEDVFSISGRGTVVTGRIDQGVVHLGDKLEIVGINETTTTTVQGIEMFRKVLDEGWAGDNVGLLLAGTKRGDVERGQVLSKPGGIGPHSHFEAEAYILTKDEMGRHTPFFNGYRPQFYFRTTDVTGATKLQKGVEAMAPGDHGFLEIELITPIAMKRGLRFAIREAGRTVGFGVVTKTLD